MSKDEISFGDIERIEGKAADGCVNDDMMAIVGMLGIIARELRRSAVFSEKNLASGEAFRLSFVNYSYAKRKRHHYDVTFLSGEDPETRIAAAEAVALVNAENFGEAEVAAWQRFRAGDLSWEGDPDLKDVRLVRVEDLGEDDGDGLDGEEA
jgi:hypothetical protein